MMADVEFQVVAGQYGAIGHITLNRAKALNALNHDMINSMYAQLNAWQVDDSIKAVWVDSVSEKAFCAGGDVVTIHNNGKQDINQVLPFFKDEYALNCLIHSYSKPYICWLDGITMGGGVGISLHGNYPLATENFSFAMPETSIGFFPDVGGGYLLTRANQPFGLYLALTGLHIKRDDTVTAGLIKYRVKQADKNDFYQSVLSEDFGTDTDAAMQSLLTDFIDDSDLDTEQAKLSVNQKLIEQSFSADSVEAIFENLKAMVNPWSDKTLAILQAKSPTALKVTFEQLKRCQGLDMASTMEIEYAMTSAFMANHDFYEGVRALLVDKDKNPQWQPAQLSDVTEDTVSGYF